MEGKMWGGQSDWTTLSRIAILLFVVVEILGLGSIVLMLPRSELQSVTMFLEAPPCCIIIYDFHNLWRALFVPLLYS